MIHLTDYGLHAFACTQTVRQCRHVHMYACVKKSLPKCRKTPYSVHANACVQARLHACIYPKRADTPPNRDNKQNEPLLFQNRKTPFRLHACLHCMQQSTNLPYLHRQRAPPQINMHPFLHIHTPPPITTKPKPNQRKPKEQTMTIHQIESILATELRDIEDTCLWLESNPDATATARRELRRRLARLHTIASLAPTYHAIHILDTAERYAQTYV